MITRKPAGATCRREPRPGQSELSAAHAPWTTAAVALAAIARRLRGWTWVPWGFLGLALTLLMLEREGASRRLDFLEHLAWDWRLTSKASVREARRCAVLCFGDSMVKLGVAPRLLEARLGESVYNLSLGAGPPAASYFLLRRALEAGACPNAVLVDFMPHSLACRPAIAQLPWPEVLHARECLDLALVMRDHNPLSAALLARIVPSYRQRFSIRAHIRRALDGEVSVSSWINLGYVRNLRVNRGAILLESNANAPGSAEPQSFHLAGSVLRCHKVNAVYLHRFLDLALKHKIAVYWLVPPVSAELHERQERSGLNAAYSRFLKQIVNQYPNVVVVDSRYSGYSSAAHADAIHLNREGAAVFSLEVAEVVARGVAGAGPARWVALPPFRVRPIAIPLEDKRQSTLAVCAWWQRSRR